MNDRRRVCVVGLLDALLTACSSTSTGTTAIQQVTSPDELKPLAFIEIVDLFLRGTALRTIALGLYRPRASA
jgi:hypothetical protein